MPVNIKGNEYKTVKEMNNDFRNNPKYEGWKILPKILEHKFNVYILIQARIYNENFKLQATGLAYEEAGSTFINKTSYVENCETSAIGRALSNLGLNDTNSYCSAEEVANAINQQKNIKERDEKIKHLLKTNADYKTIVSDINNCKTNDELKNLYYEYEHSNIYALNHLINNKKEELGNG